MTTNETNDRNVPYRMVALDLDGTLLQSNHQLADKQAEYLRSLSKSGFRICIATGRGAPSVYDIVKKLALPEPTPVVCSNGARGFLLSYNDTAGSQTKYQEELFYTPLYREAVTKTIQLAKKLGYFVQYYMEDGIYANPITDSHLLMIKDYEKLTGSSLETVDDDFEQFLGTLDDEQLPSKLVVRCRKEEFAECRPSFLELLQSNDQKERLAHIVELYHQDLDWALEILHPAVNKGQGLCNMCQKLEVSIHDVIAIGDGTNDIEFLQMSGLGIAMNNAHESLRKVATYTMEWTNDEHGVMKTLEDLKRKGKLYSSLNPIELKSLLEGPPASISTKEGAVTPSVEARLLVDCRCHLGECVLWDDRQNAVLFTSILDRKFHKLVLSENGDKALESYSLDKMLCAFGLLDAMPPSFTKDDEDENDSSPGYIVAWEDGFQLYNLEQNKPLGPMSRGEVVNRSGLPDRLNDGRVDPSGRRFVCGGCAASPEAPLKVYKCEYDPEGLKHSVILDRILTTNSICWSLSGDKMFIADSPTKTIRKFEYDLEKGTMENGTVLHSKQYGFPDGSVVDSQGYLWNATWREGEGTGMVDRIDPTTGDVVFTVYLPDETSEASCCCFGGKNLDILFITTAHENIDPESEPHSGGLYAVKLPLGMTGCQESRFRTT